MSWTDEQMGDYQGRIDAVIKEYGWMVQGVFPNGPEQGIGFAYTIGLTEAGLPELLISGTYNEQAKNLLNAIAKRHAGQELKHGDTLDDMANVPFRVIDAPQASVGIAERRYGAGKVRVLQLVWPDSHGLWPGSPFGWPAEPQELFGTRWW